MENLYFDGSLYIVKGKEEQSLYLLKDDIFYIKRLSDFVLKGEKISGSVKAIIVYSLSVFCHNMNVLRKLIPYDAWLIVISSEKAFDEIIVSDMVCIKYERNMIITERYNIFLGTFDFQDEFQGELEYNIDKKRICYRPDYKYSFELGKIASTGYSLTKHIGLRHFSELDVDGKIWDWGMAFPRDIYEYYKKNKKTYIQELNNYLLVLLDLSYQTDVASLKKLLVEHYKYSLMFSFITSYLTERLSEEYGLHVFEHIYKISAVNSPIQEDLEMHTLAINKLRGFIGNYLNGVPNKDNWRQVYYISNVNSSDIALFSFINMLLSDIRRNSILILQKNSSWFRNINTHR